MPGPAGTYGYYDLESKSSFHWWWLLQVMPAALEQPEGLPVHYICHCLGQSAWNKYVILQKKRKGVVDKVRGVWMGTGKGRTSFEMRYSVLCTIVMRLLTAQNTVEEGDGA